MGDYGLDGAGEFEGMDTNFNCLPDSVRIAQSIQKYSLIPVEIEAIQLGIDNIDRVLAWVNRYCPDLAVTKEGTFGIFLQTLKGEELARCTDYIIKTPSGSFEILKENDFNRAYKKSLNDKY